MYLSLIMATKRHESHKMKWWQQQRFYSYNPRPRSNLLRPRRAHSAKHRRTVRGPAVAESRSPLTAQVVGCVLFVPFRGQLD